MSPTEDTSEPVKFTPVLLDRIATTTMTEYEGRYYKAYLRAVGARGNRRPFEPLDELRNVFDHFSLATRDAFTVDGRKTPPNPRKREMAEKKKAITDLKKRAFLDLDQARRHLAIGRYYCAEHLIVGYIERIELTLRRMRRNGQKVPAQFRQRAAKLDDRLGRVGVLSIEGIYTSPEIEIWLRKFEAKIDKLTRLSTDLGILLRDIAASLQKSPQTS
jgi:hypothetical protein